MSNVTSNLKTEMAVVTSLILDEAKNGKKLHLVTVDERRESSAFTDGSSVIQVPVNFGNVTPQLRSVAYGFLSHEASHCRNSNFTIIRELKEKYGGLARRLLNAIEDPRIERIAIKQFPGQRDHLITTKEHVIAQGWWTGPDPQGICWQEALHSFSLFWGNVCVGFKCAEPLMKAWEKIFNDVFSHYCGKSAPDFIREQIKTAVLSDQADAPALAVGKILDLILANKDKFRQDLKNLPDGGTTSDSYDLKGLYDEEDQEQQQNNGNSGTGSNGNNAEGESTGEGSGSDSEDAEGSNADSAGSESSDENAEGEDADGSNTGSAGSESADEKAEGEDAEGDTADSNGTEADGESGAESEAEGSDTDGESDSAGSETGAEDAGDETEGSDADGKSEADAEGNSEDAEGDNAGSVGSESAESNGAADEADGNGSNTEANADEADGEGSESEGDSTGGEDAGSDGEAGGASGCTPTFGGVPLDQSKAQNEAEDAMQKAFEELQADAAANAPEAPLPIVTTCGCYNDQMTERSFMADNLSDIRNLGLKLRKEFSKKLQDKVLSVKGLKSSGTRFSGSHMAGIATGNYKIFQSKDYVKKPNASVEILLDISGSMHKETSHGRVIEIAQKAVGALMFGLDIQGIETEFSVFPGVHKQNWTGYCVVKRFDDRNTALMLKGTYLCAGGATPDAYGVMGATLNLSKRKNANKICLVLTDGDICQQTIDIMAKGKESGIKYYGIAINTQLPPYVFEKYVEVLDPTTLPDVLLKLAREVIQI